MTVTPTMLRADAKLLEAGGDHSLAQNARDAADEIKRLRTAILDYASLAPLDLKSPHEIQADLRAIVSPNRDSETGDD